MLTKREVHVFLITFHKTMLPCSLIKIKKMLIFLGSGLGKAITEYAVSMLGPIGAVHVKEPAFGVDIHEWQKSGLNAFSLYSDNVNYFWYHHTEGKLISNIPTAVVEKVEKCNVTFCWS